MTNNSLLDSLAKPPPPPSELDELMSRDPLDLSAQDIDKIIAYQRQQRARRESGTGRGRKAIAATDAEATTSVDLSALVRSMVSPAAPSTPAVSKPGAGFRRL